MIRSSLIVFVWMVLPVQIFAAGNVYNIDIANGSHQSLAVPYGYDQVHINYSGSGSLIVYGRTEHVSIIYSGNGDLDTSCLKSYSSYLRESGAGTVSMHAKDYFNIVSSGASDVTLHGYGDIDQLVRSGYTTINYADCCAPRR